MKPGPPPTPTALLNARGSWRGKAKRAEPKYDDAPPLCPEWITDKAKVYWANIQPALSLSGVLRTLDGNALARYCQMLGQWQECQEFIRNHGSTYTVKRDGAVIAVREFPQVRRASDLATQLRRLEAEFGLTPSARSRITTAPIAPNKPAEKPKKIGPQKMRLAI